MKVLVIGGAGFIGRSVVAALTACGADVVVGTRRPSRRSSVTDVTTANAMMHTELHRLAQPDDWQARVESFDVIVNCAGILRERFGESYEAVYRDAPIAIARACALLDKRFIHITALGLTDQASSGFITAKLAGEQGIATLATEMCVVRPSLLDGVDGFGSRWLRRVAQWPVHFVPADARGRLAPLHVDDLGEAIAALCACPREALPASVELGGEERYSIAQYLRALRNTDREAVTLTVPAWMVRIAAHLLDIAHLTPLSWGHVELMRRDNVPRAEDALALRKWLGRAPISIGIPPQTVETTRAGYALPTPSQ
jgi:NADH dehydrogenase